MSLNLGQSETITPEGWYTIMKSLEAYMLNQLLS